MHLERSRRKGQLSIDQGHRGYTKSDASGFGQCNPLYFKWEPSAGRFAGQHGYGYRSIAEFVAAASEVPHTLNPKP